jgi:molecular chaperone HscB
MDYFNLFNIPVSLNPDQQLLKQKFYELSRKYHPDFFTQENEWEQADALEKSSQINKAYKTLTNRDETIKYVLQSKGILETDEKYQLPPGFLMEMLEYNEVLQEAKASNDEAKLTDVKNSLAKLEDELFLPVQHKVLQYDDTTATAEDLQLVKEYYFKKKYIDRILATY